MCLRQSPRRREIGDARDESAGTRGQEVSDATAVCQLSEVTRRRRRGRLLPLIRPNDSFKSSLMQPLSVTPTGHPPLPTHPVIFGPRHARPIPSDGFMLSAHRLFPVAEWKSGKGNGGEKKSVVSLKLRLDLELYLSLGPLFTDTLINGGGVDWKRQKAEETKLHREGDR